MEEETSAPPTEMHPLLPIQGDSQPESARNDITAETVVQESAGGAASNTNPTSDDDTTDDCCRRSTPPCADDSGVVSTEPTSAGGEYKAIIDMLKDAERSANDPEYEDKVHARRFGAIKYNPRNQESSFGAVDYFCAMFQCCAVCIEG